MKLDINCKNTKITIFSKEKCDVGNFNFKFKGENIEIVEEYNEDSIFERLKSQTFRYLNAKVRIGT